jgi:hypothetical protein
MFHYVRSYTEDNGISRATAYRRQPTVSIANDIAAYRSLPGRERPLPAQQQTTVFARFLP